MRGNRQPRAQRTEIFAEWPFHDHRSAKQHHPEQDERPGTIQYTDQEGGLEGLDLGHFFRQAHRIEGHQQQHDKHPVLDPFQLVVQWLGQEELEAFEAQGTRDFVRQLGQCTIRTQPAAEQSPAPDKHGDDDEPPEDKDKRIGQEQFPFPLIDQRMEPGQNLGDARLSHRVIADKENAGDPEKVFWVSDPALVLPIGPPHQLIAHDVGHGRASQQQDKQRNFQPFALPYPQPGWIRFDDFRVATFQIARRQPVFPVEIDECLGSSFLILLVGQEHQTPGIGGAKTRTANDEDARFAETRRAGGGDVVEIEIIGVTEREAVQLLRDLNAVINTAAHETRALERTAAIGDDKNGMFVRFQISHQSLIIALAENVASHIGFVEIAKVQINIGFLAIAHVQILGHDPQMLNAAFLD